MQTRGQLISKGILPSTLFIFFPFCFTFYPQTTLSPLFLCVSWLLRQDGVSTDMQWSKYWLCTCSCYLNRHYATNKKKEKVFLQFLLNQTKEVIGLYPLSQKITIDCLKIYCVTDSLILLYPLHEFHPTPFKLKSFFFFIKATYKKLSLYLINSTAKIYAWHKNSFHCEHTDTSSSK